MASLSTALGLLPRLLNFGSIQRKKSLAASHFAYGNKTIYPERTAEEGRPLCERRATNFYGSRSNIRFAAARISVEHTEQIFTSVQLDQLKKASAYLFRTETGALIKVSVQKGSSIYAVKIEVSSLEVGGDDTELIMHWGIYRSNSSCLLPLKFHRSAQDSDNQIVKSPFLKSSSTDFVLELEFEANESPFYLSFLLRSVSRTGAKDQEIWSHRNTKFCVPVGFGSGYPAPFGLSFANDGSMNFAFYSRQSESVVLCLYESDADKPALELDLDPYVNRTGDVWHASIEGGWMKYGYRCRETSHQAKGEDGSANHVLLDPYAKFIEKSGSKNPVYLGNLCKEPAFDWGNDVFPNRPLEQLVVYRLNVKHFTQHTSSKLSSDVAGTFSGLAEKVHHLRSLGITAVLLEPIFSYNEKEGPYFPFHFFSPTSLYLPSNDSISAINSFKETIKKLHASGIEVLLEVVFTHTAKTGALQGIDDLSYYYDTRAGDSKSKAHLKCNYPIVQQLILQSLRYWVTEFHIDGFCFINASSLLRGFHGEYLSRPPLVEAIAFDPLLSKTKIIADCWDPHDHTSKQTRFPHWKKWAEVNTKYCHDIRNFLRGKGPLSDLATRLCGSGDIFTDGRGPAFSFNFVARNSGLPLVDVVSFSKPELASEFSWNCGKEGPTSKISVLERRLKQIRNFLFILFLSFGVPVLNMGDECGLSSGGSPSYRARKPFDWNALNSDFGIQITQFIAFLTSFRTSRSDILQRREYLTTENIVWYGKDQSPPKWDDPTSKFLAVTLKPEEDNNLSMGDAAQSKGDLFVAFNAANNSETVTLPMPPRGMRWRRLIDTALPFPGFFSTDGETIPDHTPGSIKYEMEPHSCSLFESIGSDG